MIMIIPVIIVLAGAHVVALLLLLETGLLQPWWLRALNDEIRREEVSAAHDEAAHGLTGLGMLRQRRVLDRLPEFKTLRLTFFRNGFVDVGGHGVKATSGDRSSRQG